MTERSSHARSAGQSLVIRRDGDHILIENVLVTTEYHGVLKSTVLDAATAAELFLSGLAIARKILREKATGST